MNLRLTKELRPLLLPWSIAALGALGNCTTLFGPVFSRGEFGQFLLGLAGFAFIMGVLVLAATPIASELQDRTLTLFITQPISRTHLWKEKIFAASLAVVALAVIHGISNMALGHLHRTDALLCGAFIIAALCSVGYFTLATGSIVVGIATAAGTPFSLALSVHLIIYYLLGVEVTLTDQQTLILILAATAVYSAVFLWLSHRQFVRLELNAGSVSRAAEVPRALVPRGLTELFRARPTGVVSNLIRKEFCLQKPIFLVSAVFAVCWIITLLLRILHPAWHDNLVAVFHGITGTQVLLMVILIPCIALGDDKSLSAAAWHLTLPVSSFHQWALKLFSAAAVFVLTAIVLPFLLAILVLPFAHVGLIAFINDTFKHPSALLTVGSLLTAAFILSFWSASLAPNTVKAAITSVFAIIGTVICVIVGAPIPEFVGRSPGFETNLVGAIASHFQLPPSTFEKVLAPIAILIALAAIIVALRQSLLQFRRTQTSRSILIKYPLILAALIVGGSIWCHDLLNSYREWENQFFGELSGALYKLSHEHSFSPTAPTTVSLQQLEATQTLSPHTIHWLRNCPMTVLPDTFFRGQEQWYSLHVIFPDGKSYRCVQIR